VSLSNDGNTLAIGAPRVTLGFTYVYEYKSESGWQLLGPEIEGEDGPDNFFSVKIHPFIHCILKLLLLLLLLLLGLLGCVVW
jgi:hypothetical protein